MVDPRHPSLGVRVLSLEKAITEQNFAKMMAGGSSGSNAEDAPPSSLFPHMPGTYSLIRKLSGIAEGFEVHGRVAGETNQEFLNSVSFSKGCYLGQELTARVQYTGAIRKRVMPLFITDLNMQIPQPWLIASQIQAKELAIRTDAEHRNDDEILRAVSQSSDSDGEHGISDSGNTPRLPRLSASAAGALVGMMSGSSSTGSHQSDTDADTTEKREQLEAQSRALFERLQTHKIGEKIVDLKDGKTIGQIVALPEPGTNVLLAQMRLDRVGLLGQNYAWSHTNKVTLGEEEPDPVRFLPYLPLWWPSIDRSTGKAQE
jgi:folate-binding protein YgfZ